MFRLPTQNSISFLILPQHCECTICLITPWFGDRNNICCRSQWPRGLRRRSAAARLLSSWVRISPEAWMFVCCECYVLSGRGLFDELITRPEESYRMWCVVVCDQETSRMRRPWPALGRSSNRKKNNICWRAQTVKLFLLKFSRFSVASSLGQSFFFSTLFSDALNLSLAHWFYVWHVTFLSLATSLVVSLKMAWLKAETCS